MKKIYLVFFLFFIGIISVLAQQKKFITYKVLDGETVKSISKKLAITPYDLLKLNPDVIDEIGVNDIIIVPNKNYDPKKDIENGDLSSVGIKDIIVDGYIYHETLKGETLYSLLKNFSVSREILNELNPLLLKYGLKEAQIVKIPVRIDAIKILEKEKATQPYLVKSKETKFGIARKYGISIAYLEALNPKIKEKGLQNNDVILVPSKVVNKPKVDLYKIKKSETLYGLSNKFGVSQEELIAKNPQLRDGVKEGSYIKIPSIDVKEIPLFLDKKIEGLQLNVAIMLPFQSKRDSLDFEKDRLLQISTDFYFGALQAIDLLKQKGLSMQVKVYDTQKSEFVSKQLSNKVAFEDYDVVIGPLFFKNIKTVSENLKFKKAVIISPISQKSHASISNKKVIQEVASNNVLALEMLQFIKKNYSNQKLLLIVDDEVNANIRFNSIYKEVKALDTLNKIVILKPKGGYIKPEIYKENIKEGVDNWILVIGTAETFIRDVFNNLGVSAEENKITLFLFEKGENFDKIDNNYLARVNCHYPTPVFLDKTTASYINFENKYKETYYLEPSKYAVQGFDITYDVLMRLAVNKNLTSQGLSQRLATKYHFIENTSGSTVNQGMFIVKYEGLELKMVK